MHARSHARTCKYRSGIHIQVIDIVLCACPNRMISKQNFSYKCDPNFNWSLQLRHINFGSQHTHIHAHKRAHGGSKKSIFPLNVKNSEVKQTEKANFTLNDLHAFSEENPFIRLFGSQWINILLKFSFFPVPLIDFCWIKNQLLPSFVRERKSDKSVFKSLD